LIIIIINVSVATNPIRRISEGSCDTEDWSNDAENSALHIRNKLHFKIYYKRELILNCNYISQCDFFYQITAALGRQL